MSELQPTSPSTPAPVPAPEAPATLPATALLEANLTAAESSIPQAKTLIDLIRAHVLTRLRQLETYTHTFPVLLTVRKSTGVPPITFAVAAILAAVYAVRRATRVNAPLVANLFGVLYPAYSSLRAIERPKPDDDERWLTYWSVFGLYSLLDSFAERIRRYFPLYFTSKVVVLYWLFSRNGSLTIYRNAVRPLLINYDGLNAANSIASGSTTAYHSRESSASQATPYKV
ncbi:Receptor expression-enhancing protein 5 [Dinochytrium kinnereticum]|nr:Receptor expression-enhancing protein 5 [Dinochytrium kinnereticum]